MSVINIKRFFRVHLPRHTIHAPTAMRSEQCHSQKVFTRATIASYVVLPSVCPVWRWCTLII